MEEMNAYRQQPTSNADRKPEAPSDAAAAKQETKSFSDRSDGASPGRLDHPLIPAQRVNGSAVYNQAGEEIGKIEDVAIDKRTGKVAYAILSFGGFLGLGGKNQPLPWSALAYNTGRGGYVVDVTEEFLRLAPKLDPSDLSGWDDSARRDEFHAYYAGMGARPYW